MQTHHHITLYVSSLSFLKMPTVPSNFSCSDSEICRLNCQISPSNSTALLQRETRTSIPFLYQFEFFTRSHFFTSSVTSSFLQNAFPETVFLSAPKRRKPEGERYGLGGSWGRRVHPIFFIVSCVFKIVWVCVVVLKETFSNTCKV
jgi:hypothetical protein